MKCYNGAWDNEAKALFTEQDRLMSAIKKIEPEAHCTYFPMNGFYHIHVWGKLLGPERSNKLDALQDALNYLKEGKTYD